MFCQDLSGTVKEKEICFAIFGKNFDEIALSRTVKEIEGNLFCHFWQKFENSKWPPFLGRGKFLENCKDCIP